MKKWLWFFCLQVALQVQAENFLSGKITDMTIGAFGSPYTVSENLIVPYGQTLIIDTGTVLLFKPFSGLIVEGSLLVHGSLEKPVVFTSDNDSRYNTTSSEPANPFDWNGILISPKAGLVKLSNFKLEYSVYGIKSQKEEFIIANGTFINNGQFHVTVNDAIKNVVEDTPFNFGKDLNSEAMLVNNKTTRLPWQKPLAISLGATAAAALGSSGYAYYLSTEYHKKYDETSGDPMYAFIDKADEMLTASFVSVVAGGLFAIGGTAIYWWKPAQKTAKEKISVAPILGWQNGVLITVNY